ncbi:rhodanese-like domain-containing protein [Nereida sp. MMG025]|uniref:rhodanese-like domain-containing protein n=1 Tax=Nereida sp. MMG025 TaxID=2909981 RepID=UPI001F4377B2|nr:rhodanese-like domain-containing protein [Nereida sp. MMG025]MCF6444447.1 rhodanese-like domain-containing protein [Nereida sp. MMG025]
MKRSLYFGASVIAVSGTALFAQAQADQTSFNFNGQDFTITRAAQVNLEAVARFSAPDLSCEGKCLSPMVAADGVDTIGELDVMTFMTQAVANGSGLIVDARLPENRSIGFIPASVNVPLPTMEAENPFRQDILLALGARALGDTLNFSDAMDLVVFDAGPGTTDAQRMINNLLDAGYPAEKIKYYRGGMQVWTALGLTTQEQPS